LCHAYGIPAARNTIALIANKSAARHGALTNPGETTMKADQKSPPSTIKVEIAAGIATITLNRPHRKNSMTLAMIDEVYSALCEIANKDDIHVVVLTGSNNWFCPGGDIEAVVNGESAAELARGFDFITFRVPVLLHEMPQLTIAAINGPCAAAGLGWALACDLRFAAESSKFSTAFLDRGIAGDMSVPWTLPRIVGPALARELSFLPSRLHSRRAHAIGLVNDVFEDSAFAERMLEITKRLLSVDAKALRTLKSHYVAAERMQLIDFADHEARIVAGSVNTNVHRFEAFLESRDHR
jgi:2-(1,2-epoxy-1,2-dihydrophenyl)acetyl-CoA isomerase